ncbi:MAG TPA: hypothetical protein VFX42_00900 [Gemmatimonadales bacterium]|nr:hypothetical protein [Gemmatimonadales bacterium]
MSARANGEGSIYLRKDGRWSAAAYVLRPDGGRVRRKVYGRTRAEASQKLTGLLSKTAAGIPLAGQAWTVRSYADHWLETVARARLRPAIWTNYSYAVRVHIGLLVRCPGAYRAESRLRSVAIPDPGSCVVFG